MHKTTLFLIFLCSQLISQSIEAANVSKKDLEAIEIEVEQKNVEHKRLQAQAAKISVEMAAVSKQMIAKAREIQNTEEKISQMEKELRRLQKELEVAQENFLLEDENLIHTLYALQNLALKPTESLFVQPMTPVEIIRSAMLLRETVPFLAEEAASIRAKLEAIAEKKSKIEQQVQAISINKRQLEQEHRQLQQLIHKKAKIRSQIEDKSEETRQRIKELAAQAKDIKELSLTYDGKKLDLLSKTSYDTYLYGDVLFKYSDTSIKILQEIANAKEITIEGRNVIGRKYTQKLTNKDIAMFKKMLTVVQNVHAILKN